MLGIREISCKNNNNVYSCIQPLIDKGKYDLIHAWQYNLSKLEKWMGLVF